MFNQIVPKFGRQCRPLCLRFGRGLCTKGKNDIPIRAPWRRHDRLSPFEAFTWPIFMRRGRGPFEELEEMTRTMDKIFNLGRLSHFAESGARTEVEQVRYTGKIFEIKIDVQEYSPEELNVKLVGNDLTITGQHERKQDGHGYVSRRFSREFLVPEDVDLETFESSVSEDGVMTLRANVKGAEKAEEKKIEIKFEKADKKDDSNKT